MDRQNNQKEAIIAEYLAGGISYRELSAKYGIRHQSIHYWVQEYQGITRIRKPSSRKGTTVLTTVQNPIPLEVKQLQRELFKAQLHNKLLNAMIDIAEEQLNVNIRKKSGARQ